MKHYIQAEVEAFSEGISQMEEGGMRGKELVEGVLKGVGEHC